MLMRIEHKQNSMVLALKFEGKEALILCWNACCGAGTARAFSACAPFTPPTPVCGDAPLSLSDTTNVYLAFDYVGGGDLFFLLRGMGRMPLAWSTFVGAEVCLALEHVHNHGIVFRDLKPRTSSWGWMAI